MRDMWWQSILAFVLYLILGILKYRTGRYGVDTTYFVNALWNTLHGAFAYASGANGSVLGQHFGPLWLLMLPGFAVWNSPVVIIVFKAALWGISVAAASILAAENATSKIFQRIWVLFYCLHPVVMANFYWDFNEVHMALPILMWLTVCMIKQKWTHVAALAVLSWFTKEDMPIVMLGVSAFLAIRYRKYKMAVGLAAASLAAFLIIVEYVMPSFPGGAKNLHWVYFAQLGGSLRAVVIKLLTQPQKMIFVPWAWRKLVFLTVLFASFGFLPLRKPVWLICIMPTLFYLWIMYRPDVFHYHSHYVMPMIPFLFVSSITGFPESKSAPRIALALAFSIAALLSLRYTLVFSSAFDTPENLKSVHRAVAMVAGCDKVCSDYMTGVYLALRPIIDNFDLKTSVGPNCSTTFYDAYVLNLHLLYVMRGRSTEFLPASYFVDEVFNLDRCENYHRAFHENGVVVWLRGKGESVGEPVTLREIKMDSPPERIDRIKNIFVGKITRPL